MKKPNTKSKDKFSVSLHGLNANGVDALLTVSGDTAAEFAENLSAAQSACPISPFGKSEPTPVDAPKCPKCGGEVYDNRQRRGDNDRRPLLKCKLERDCGWILWREPKTDREKSDAALWNEKNR